MVSKTKISLKTENGTENRSVAFPDTCPNCFHRIDARPIDGYLFEDPFDERMEIIFQCPRSDCRHLFIAYYDQFGTNDTHLADVQPKKYIPKQFSKFIASISKDFITIYNQAKSCEELELALVMGPGYRKALEFLIKDYANKQNPDSVEAIKSKLLGKVIEEYVADARIKSTAKRAAWLGNDEAHYYKKWSDKDINDLKLLIELTVRWIESEELTRHYEENMKV